MGGKGGGWGNGQVCPRDSRNCAAGPTGRLAPGAEIVAGRRRPWSQSRAVDRDPGARAPHRLAGEVSKRRPGKLGADWKFFDDRHLPGPDRELGS